MDNQPKSNTAVVFCRTSDTQVEQEVLAELRPSCQSIQPNNIRNSGERREPPRHLADQRLDTKTSFPDSVPSFMGDVGTKLLTSGRSSATGTPSVTVVVVDFPGLPRFQFFRDAFAYCKRSKNWRRRRPRKSTTTLATEGVPVAEDLPEA